MYNSVDALNCFEIIGYLLPVLSISRTHIFLDLKLTLYLSLRWFWQWTLECYMNWKLLCSGTYQLIVQVTLVFDVLLWVTCEGLFIRTYTREGVSQECLVVFCQFTLRCIRHTIKTLISLFKVLTANKIINWETKLQNYLRDRSVPTKKVTTNSVILLVGKSRLVWCQLHVHR